MGPAMMDVKGASEGSATGRGSYRGGSDLRQNRRGSWTRRTSTCYTREKTSPHHFQDGTLLSFWLLDATKTELDGPELLACEVIVLEQENTLGRPEHVRVASKEVLLPLREDSRLGRRPGDGSSSNSVLF